MKKSRITEEQIIGFLKEAEAVSPLADICWRDGFSDATFYKWRAKFGGMEATKAQRLSANVFSAAACVKQVSLALKA